MATLTDNELILKALYSALEDCYSPELKSDYMRLIKKIEGDEDEQQQIEL